MTNLTDKYAAFVARGNFTRSDQDSRFLGPMGLSGEAGEVQEVLLDRGVGEADLAVATSKISERFKKHLLHYKPLDREELVKEMGDVLWYFFLICNNEGLNFDEIIVANVVKICDRYPDRHEDPSGWLP